MTILSLSPKHESESFIRKQNILKLLEVSIFHLSDFQSIKKLTKTLPKQSV